MHTKQEPYKPQAKAVYFGYEMATMQALKAVGDNKALKAKIMESYKSDSILIYAVCK